MTEVLKILSNTAHRPFELPVGKWRYYQEWNRLLFFHWKVPHEVLREAVPRELIIDTFQNDCYVSLVPFTMENVRPAFLPAVGFVSNFHEINLRTYIQHHGKGGVYFFSLEAQKYLSAYLSRRFSGLPYEKASIIRGHKNYTAMNRTKAFSLDVEFEIGEKIDKKTALDKWLTERYRVYFVDEGNVYQYDVHHQEWTIRHVELKRFQLDYAINKFSLANRKPDLVHYSDGVKVLAWSKKKIICGNE